MPSKLYSFLAKNNHVTMMLFFFAISIWTYFSYVNGLQVFWSSDEKESEIKSTRTAGVNFGTISITPDLKSHDENGTLAHVLEKEQMACHIPKLNPVDDSIKKYLKGPKPANCETDDHPLIFQTDFNSTIIQVKNPEDYGYFNCCYKEFKREKKDSEVVESQECTNVTNFTVVPSHYESITIYCNKLNGTSTITVPVDMFYFVHLKPQVEKRVQEWQDGKELQHRRVNIVILGIDAVSHMNFHRVMPKTLKYINEQLNAIGMDGYTKVGENTFPNIVAATANMTVEEVKRTCWKSSQTPIDSCPFIWKNYSANGYRTAYGEDSISMGIFNFQKRGFLEPPTDYYDNAFTYRLDKVLSHSKLPNCKQCYGPRLGFQVSLDFLRAMAIRMGNQRRYFQFVWATSLFHDTLNQGKVGDEPLLETMKWFNEENQLENTVFILMSDHGIRYGDIRKTIQGKIEERMPFLYFIFPEWFKEQYRSAVSNLIRNKARLTTPFDLHHTLLDLLHLENIKETILKERYKSLQVPKLPRGMSLFLPVPAKRTCNDAGINEHWCVCQRSVALKDPNVPIVRQAAYQVVDAINNKFIEFPQCARLTLDAIFNAQVMQTESKAVKDSSSNVTSLNDKRLKHQQLTYSVSFSVSPSDATFEATITRHTDGEWKVSGDISRTNLYGTQSHCVTDYNMKKFCYCS